MNVKMNGNKITISDQTAMLTKKQMCIFRILCAASPRVVSKEDICDATKIMSVKTLTQHVNLLRNRLSCFSEIEIITHFAVGYELEIKLA